MLILWRDFFILLRSLAHWLPCVSFFSEKAIRYFLWHVCSLLTSFIYIYFEIQVNNYSDHRNCWCRLWKSSCRPAVLSWRFSWSFGYPDIGWSSYWRNRNVPGYNQFKWCASQNRGSTKHYSYDHWHRWYVIGFKQTVYIREVQIWLLLPLPLINQMRFIYPINQSDMY